MLRGIIMRRTLHTQFPLYESNEFVRTFDFQDFQDFNNDEPEPVRLLIEKLKKTENFMRKMLLPSKGTKLIIEVSRGIKCFGSYGKEVFSREKKKFVWGF